MTTQYWLVKSEPTTYSFADLQRDRRTDWTGVRNYAARLHLNAMRPGDQALVYHSGDDKAVVGLAEITRGAFPDPTAEEPGWVAVELKAGKSLARPVTLSQVKATPALSQMALIRISRLSVQPVTREEFETIIKLGRG